MSIATWPGRRRAADWAMKPAMKPRTEAGEKPVTPPYDDAEKARRFREAALPHLDDVYTLARYLRRNPADAEDAVKDCFLRAVKLFNSYGAPAMRPWLSATLPIVCPAEFARRAGAPVKALDDA